MDYSQYGLTRVDASKSNHDKGIVSDGKGGFLKIDGFSHGQKKGTDRDRGDVFGSSLEKDSGGDFSNFNTATDVEGALAKLTSPEPEVESILDDQPPRFAHSPKVAHAKARLAQHQEDVFSGKTGTDLFGDTASTDPAQSFLERYKLKLGKQDDNGNYFEPEQVN